MVLDLTGIVNHEDFFFEHYLASLFESDLKDRLSQWEGEGAKSPAKKVREHLGRWNLALRKRELSRKRDSDEDTATLRPEMAALLADLGFPVENNLSLRTVQTRSCQGLLLLANLVRPDALPGAWVLWVNEPDTKDVDANPLNWPIAGLEWDAPLSSLPAEWRKGMASVEEFLRKEVFSSPVSPRWVLVCSAARICLLERSKWTEARWVEFDLETISDRKNEGTCAVMASLLHAQSLVPQDGTCLLDTLDESSHKHAFGVSEDLKYALRECIEDLGNEAVWYLREQKLGVFDRDLAPLLSREMVRTMYRLLFLFYLEGRPELGYFPPRAKGRGRDAYWSGYSVETLRDLELVKLTTDESRNGTFLHESLSRLMNLVQQGFAPKEQTGLYLGSELPSQVGGFSLEALGSHLFDPMYDPEPDEDGQRAKLLKMLSRVKFRNFVWQKVIFRMSLGRMGGRKGRRVRISYAQLGINQLGAVYEGLLSFRGFFAEEDLYEVRPKPKKEKRTEDDSADGDDEGNSTPDVPATASKEPDPLDTAYFVTERQLAQCERDEVVWVGEGAHAVPKKYPKGTFIYRMAGRDREKSASYYTPSELSRTLVKYSLKERLEGLKADDILKLTVCEPAMGSAAFLNEAVDQMADAYLERKQRETGKLLPSDQYGTEKQRVKMFLADNNVFGVDLNPTAVELAEVSLWLGTLHERANVPWFRLQLNVGNSLIGARRETFGVNYRTQDTGVPMRQGWKDALPEKDIWHWLLPDPGQGNFDDKTIRGIVPKDLERFKNWRKGWLADLTKTEQETLRRLTAKAEELWQTHATQLDLLRRRTSDAYTLWPDVTIGEGRSGIRAKDQIVDGEMYSRHLHAASAYRRLKLCMDYWCALWFWPLEKSNLLPSRTEWLFELSAILQGTVDDAESSQELSLFPTTAGDDLKASLRKHGIVDVEKLANDFPRFALVQTLAERHRFLHWELEYSDIFCQKGGFDLVLGNPPWLKVEWDESGVMGDANALFVLRKRSASEMAILRAEALTQVKGLQADYLAEYESTTGTQNFLNATQNYPELKGSQTNLYKCFLPLSWKLATPQGVQAFVHPEGVYDDPKGGELRRMMYLRLRHHFQFVNVKKLFQEILHWVTYSLNIYGMQRASPGFISMSNLFLPQMIQGAFEHSGSGVVPGIKTDEGQWDLRGHKSRLIHVTDATLGLFASLYDEVGTSSAEARLPAVHSAELVDVLRRFVASGKRLGDLSGQYHAIEMWHETGAQKDGTIRRDTRFPEKAEQWILSGPHFFVGNPFSKSPDKICNNHHQYSMVDLASLPDDYLPRTNYLPDVDAVEYRRRTPVVPWKVNDREAPVTDFYRLAYRAMLSQSGERTLIGTIIPPGAGHINGVQSTTFKELSVLVQQAAFGMSVVADFYIKSTGRSNLHGSWEVFPVLELSPEVASRALSLVCLTTHYRELWESCWDPAFATQSWASPDPSLPQGHFAALTKDWTRSVALRSDLARRQALVELDVLAAQALGLTLDELLLLYRIQFPVLQQNEADTWYDTRGRIVFTASKGLPGVGLPRKLAKSRLVSTRRPDGLVEVDGSKVGWEDIRDLPAGHVVTRTVLDTTLPTGPVQRVLEYHAPFTRRLREDSYREAWPVLAGA